MRHKPLGFKQSLAFRRQLGCERLEHRALLTALIASAEIAPGPIAEFTMQAESFVHSALEHVKLTQHQTPVKTTKAMLTGLTEDGRSVRIHKYMVELDIRPQSLPLVVGGTSVPTESRAATMPPLATRSNLVFSFMIYTDSSVSIRAKLNNPPQWVGFASTNFDHQERLRMRSSPVDNTLAKSSPSPGFTVYSRDAQNWYDVAESNESLSTSMDSDSRLTRANHVAEHETTSQAEAHPLDSLLGQMIVIEFGSEPTADPILRDAPAVEPSAASANSVADRSPAKELPEADAMGDNALPIPRGMIQLHIPQFGVPQHEDAIANLPASAIYQVFLDSSDSVRLEAVAERGEVARLREPAAVSIAEEVEPRQWRTTTLALASLVGGLVWGLRPQRGQQEEDLRAT